METFSTFCFILFAFVLTQEVWSQHNCPRPRLPNGRVKIRVRGKMVYFKCRRRFARLGHKIALCVAGGKWSHDPPVCITKGCPALAPNPNILVTESFNGAKLDFECPIGYKREGPEYITCNGRKWNAPPPTCSAGMILSCTFEDVGLCGWSQDSTDNFDWTRFTGATPTVNTGPHFDHTFGNTSDGHYIYIETSAPRAHGDQARLISPIFPQSLGGSGKCLEFWYHMNGPDDRNVVGSLEIYLKPESESLEDVASSFFKEGNQGTKWLRGMFEINSQPDNFRIIIVGTRNMGFVSDIAVDDIRIFNCSEETTTPEPTTVVTTPTTESAAVTTPKMTSTTESFNTTNATMTTSDYSADTGTYITNSTDVAVTTEKGTTYDQTTVTVTSESTQYLTTQAPVTVEESTQATESADTSEATTTVATTVKSTVSVEGTRRTRRPKPASTTSNTTYSTVSETPNITTESGIGTTEQLSQEQKTDETRMTDMTTNVSTLSTTQTTTTAHEIETKDIKLTTETLTTQTLVNGTTVELKQATSNATGNITIYSTLAEDTENTTSGKPPFYVLTQQTYGNVTDSNRLTTPRSNVAINTTYKNRIIPTVIVSQNTGRSTKTNFLPLIIGVSTGIVVGMIVIGILAWLWARNQRRKKAEEAEDEMYMIGTSEGGYYNHN